MPKMTFEATGLRELEDWFSDDHIAEMVTEAKAELNALVTDYFETVIVPSIPVGPSHRKEFKPGDLMRSANLTHYDEHPLYASWEITIGGLTESGLDIDYLWYAYAREGVELFPGNDAIQEAGDRIMRGEKYT